MLKGTVCPGTHVIDPLPWPGVGSPWVPVAETSHSAQLILNVNEM